MTVPVHLSPRQRQVCAYLAEGHSDKQIAAALKISESTVDHHLKKLFGKFGVHSRTALAVAYAVRKHSLCENVAIAGTYPRGNVAV